MAYMYPLVLMVRDTEMRKITVRECGPLDDWLRLLAHACDVEIVQAGTMLERLVREAQGAVILEPLDDPASFDSGQLRDFRETFSMLTGIPIPVVDQRGAVVLSRGAAHPFYTQSGDDSASMRRSLADVGTIGEHVGAHVSTRVIDAADMTPAEQVDAFARAQVLVGQHGAGLTNMIWMRAPGVVVEILPGGMPGVNRSIFRNLASALSLQYVAVPQDGSHGHVDPRAVEEAVASFLAAG